MNLRIARKVWNSPKRGVSWMVYRRATWIAALFRMAKRDRRNG